MPKAPKITRLQNLCNISRKKMKDEVDFLEQINVKVFDRLMQSYLIGMIRGIPKIFKITMQYLCNISGKRWVMKLIFCMLINIVFRKLILSFWWVWPGMPKVPRPNKLITQTQYLPKFAIYLKKKVKNISIFRVYIDLLAMGIIHVNQRLLQIINFVLKKR